MSNWLNYLGIILGAVGVIFAIQQIIVAKRVRRLYEKLCSERCKSLAELVIRLGEEAKVACETVYSENMEKAASTDHHVSRDLRILSTSTGAVVDLVDQIGNFCIRLNNDHEREFKSRFLGEQLLEKLKNLPCVELIKKAKEHKELSINK